MRRKIEKFLAKKMGCDEANIRYMDDGRFDFMGDLEGVIAAVRGKDGTGRGRGKSSIKAKKQKKRSNEPSAPQHPLGHLSNLHHGMPHHGGMAYLVRGPPFMAPPGMHAQMMASGAVQKPIMTSGKENNLSRPGTLSMAQPPLIVSSSMDNGPRNSMFTFSPNDMMKKDGKLADDPMNEIETNGMSPFFGMSTTPASTMKTPFHADTDFSSNYFSSGKKSFFDSPKRAGALNGMSSPSFGGMHGMTPLSHLKDTFSNTPFTGESMRLFSPNHAMYNDDLNKTLFEDDLAMSDSKRRFVMKTPRAKSPKQISFQIGSDLSKGGMEPQLSHVTISPISQLASGGTSKTTQGMTDDLSNSGQSLAQVSLSSSDKKESLTTSSVLKRKATSTDEERMPPPVTVSFSESRDDSILRSVLKCSLSEDREDPSPRNVTLDESMNSHMEPLEQSPFNSFSTLGGMPTPGGDNSFWRTQFGFSPANNSLTPFKSPAPFALTQGAQYSPANDAFVSSMLTKDEAQMKSPDAKRRKTSDAVADQ
jgi:hypothetical protein